MMKKIIKFTLLSVLILVVGFVLGVLLNGINFSRFKEETIVNLTDNQKLTKKHMFFKMMVSL